MKKQISLNLSNKAAQNLTRMSHELGLTHDEFASLCFEYVDIKHRGIIVAAKEIRETKERAKEKNLSQHLEQLSAEQIELLLSKAAEKKKN